MSPRKILSITLTVDYQEYALKTANRLKPTIVSQTNII